MLGTYLLLYGYKYTADKILNDIINSPSLIIERLRFNWYNTLYN